MAVRSMDMLLVGVVVVTMATSILGMDLADLLRSRQRHNYAEKRRISDGKYHFMSSSVNLISLPPCYKA